METSLPHVRIKARDDHPPYLYSPVYLDSNTIFIILVPYATKVDLKLNNQKKNLVHVQETRENMITKIKKLFELSLMTILINICS